MQRGRPRNFDKTEALDTALKLFWQHGYEGTSMAMLTKTIGVNVELYHESLKKKTAHDVARSVLEGEVALVTRRGTPDGCLMIQGALATSPDAERIRKMMAQMRAMAEKWMADRFRQAIDEGDLPSDADPTALACYLMTINSGLAVQAKSGVSKKQLLKVVEIAMREWPASGKAKAN